MRRNTAAPRHLSSRFRCVNRSTARQFGRVSSTCSIWRAIPTPLAPMRGRHPLREATAPGLCGAAHGGNQVASGRCEGAYRGGASKQGDDIMSVADLPAILGAVLILAGIGLVCYQLIWAP